MEVRDPLRDKYLFPNLLVNYIHDRNAAGLITDYQLSSIKPAKCDGTSQLRGRLEFDREQRGYQQGRRDQRSEILHEGKLMEMEGCGVSGSPSHPPEIDATHFVDSR